MWFTDHTALAVILMAVLLTTTFNNVGVHATKQQGDDQHQRQREALRTIFSQQVTTNDTSDKCMRGLRPSDPTNMSLCDFSVIRCSPTMAGRYALNLPHGCNFALKPTVDTLDLSSLVNMSFFDLSVLPRVPAVLAQSDELVGFWAMDVGLKNLTITDMQGKVYTRFPGKKHASCKGMLSCGVIDLSRNPLTNIKLDYFCPVVIDSNTTQRYSALSLGGVPVNAPIPPCLNTVVNLFLSGSGVTGTIPDSALRGIAEVHLDQNQLVGTIPSHMFMTATTINISSNAKLGGSLPTAFGDKVSGFPIIDLSRTNLTGAVPDVWGTAICNGPRRRMIDVSYTNLDQPLPAFMNSFVCPQIELTSNGLAMDMTGNNNYWATQQTLGYGTDVRDVCLYPGWTCDPFLSKRVTSISLGTDVTLYSGGKLLLANYPHLRSFAMSATNNRDHSARITIVVNNTDLVNMSVSLDAKIASLQVMQTSPARTSILIHNFKATSMWGERELEQVLCRGTTPHAVYDLSESDLSAATLPTCVAEAQFLSMRLNATNVRGVIPDAWRALCTRSGGNRSIDLSRDVDATAVGNIPSWVSTCATCTFGLAPPTNNNSGDAPASSSTVPIVIGVSVAVLLALVGFAVFV
eukprot:PhM_4_TR18679/c0_g1_i3/m.71205